MKRKLFSNSMIWVISVAVSMAATAQDAPNQPNRPLGAEATVSEADSPREKRKPDTSAETDALPGEAPKDPAFTKDLEKMVEREAERKKESDKEAVKAQAMARPDPQMQAVLDKLASLEPKPIIGLSAEDARKQPSPANAVAMIAKDQNKKADPIGKVEDIDIKLSTVDLKGRVYRPEGDGPFPVVLYIHGGGWVIADLDTYDATPRALCKATNAVVISTHYRQAPENKFPAAHNDVYGAYQWTMENAGRWSGNGKKVAVVGESAGGNMAAALCIMAQAEGKQMPVHQVLIYPVAGTSMNTESYVENKDAKPLNAAMMKWFMDQTLSSPADSHNPKIALLEAETLKGLPPATIITAQIDPLRSDGEAFAKKLEKDGVPVVLKNYEGVTHEFFGMGLVVDKAKEAVDMVAARLNDAFAETGSSNAATDKAE